MNTYCVHVRDLRISSRQGVYPSEKRKPQPFVVSLHVTARIPHGGFGDHLAHTLDYDMLKLLVQQIFDDRVNNLLESVAEAIADRLLEKPMVVQVAVTIEKPDAWVSGVPGITLVRARSAMNTKKRKTVR